MSSWLCALLASAWAPAQPAQPGAGLDSLNDDRLLNELAARGLNTLLDRAFEVNKVPPTEQESRRAMLALQTLSDPTKKLSARQRQELIAKVAGSIEQILPRMRDPEALIAQANLLIDKGVKFDVNTLEYWGENLTVMSRLRPIAQAAGKTFERAAQLAQERGNALANKANPNDAATMALLDKADLLQNLATYNARMNDYAIAIAIDPADPQRKTIADGAIEYLKNLDTEDQPVRLLVRTMIAKLNMVKGDFDTARKLLDEMLKPGFKPPPAVPEDVYEAHYFRAVLEVLDKKVDGAKKAMADLLAWQQASPPSDKSKRDSAAAAASMLEYRIASLQADLATDAKAKEQFNAAGRAILLKLQSEHPEFRGIISDLIIARLPEKAPMAELDTLMLDALVRRGVAEVQRPENTKADTATLERAISAANELLNPKRRDFDPQSLENAAFVLGYLHQRLGNDIDSINAFLSYVEKHPQADRAAIALQNAEAGIVKAKKAGAEDARLGEAYDRFLPLAINPPYNRKVLALQYAIRLQKLNKPAEALKYFAQVPPDDSRQLTARFYQMIASKQLLDQLKATDAKRPELLAQIQKLADDVNKLAVEAMKDEKQRADAQSMTVRTKLLAAELARVDQKDPNRAISLLNGFESDVEGLPNKAKLLNEALLIRVQSLMAAGDYNKASETLVKLLSQTDGGQGADIVYALLLKLDADYDKAQQAGDKAAMKTLARNRANLSGFLVNWAKNNPNERIKSFTYRYQVYEADTKHRAASTEDDPATSKPLSEEALKLYGQLESPEGVAAYRATLPASKQADAAYDPAVARGIALVQYDLGNYAEAQKRLATLLKDGRFGSPLMDVNQDGETRTFDNDAYWEAILKLIRCNLKLDADIEGQKGFLKNLSVRWQDRFGGTKWKDEFGKLKAELIPDFNPEKLEAPTTAP